MRPAKFLIPTCLAVAATGAVAVAAIPNSDGTLQGCYMSGGTMKGLLRVVDSSADCKSTETAISWSQRGPKGDPGPSGSGGLEALTLGGEAVTGGRADVFLTIPGVAGPVTAAGHEGDIELESFAFDMRSTTTVTSTLGKTVFNGVHVTKLVDQSSGPIMKMLTKSTRIPKVTVSFRPVGGRRDTLKYELEDVLITNYSQGGKAEPETLENIDVQFAALTTRFTPTNPDGTAGAEVLFSFDQVRQAER